MNHTICCKPTSKTGSEDTAPPIDQLSPVNLPSQVELVSAGLQHKRSLEKGLNTLGVEPTTTVPLSPPSPVLNPTDENHTPWVPVAPQPDQSPKVEQAVAYFFSLTSSLLSAVLMAPHKLKESMSDDSSFRLVWGSGASHSISNNKGDFVEPLRSTGVLKKLAGLAQGVNIQGVGRVEWTVTDVNGSPRTLSVDAYYVPNSPVRLMSTAQLLQFFNAKPNLG